MKNSVLAVFALFLALPVFSQSDSLAWRQIDEQVWYPFIEHWGNYDAPAFNALHTPDMIRGGPWGLRTGEEYFDSNLQHWPEHKAAGQNRDIAFTFEHRVVGDGVAYEVGYYQVSNPQDPTAEPDYGQFHVVLRQVDNVWKIAQDWDAEFVNGHRVGEMDFLRYAKSGVLKK